MNELSLFSGAGGGLLASKLLGWKTVGYVEYEDYCQRVIRARINDGYLDEAPIFGDIRTFISDGYADAYQGVVDVVSAGFPCQPFSTAGQRKGEDDERNMWPATIEIIRRIKPTYCLLENVRGLLSASVDDESGRSIFYFGTILRDLAESGFDARWRILSAAETGAPHKRDRLWIACSNTDSNGRKSNHESQEGQQRIGRGDALSKSISMDECLAHSDSIRSQRRDGSRAQGHGKAQAGSIGPSDRTPPKFALAHSENKRDLRGARKLGNVKKERGGYGGSKDGRGEWWKVEPQLGRVADGVAHRVDRLKALGNGQVPAVAATAWRLLNVST